MLGISNSSFVSNSNIYYKKHNFLANEDEKCTAISRAKF